MNACKVKQLEVKPNESVEDIQEKVVKVLRRGKCVKLRTVMLAKHRSSLIYVRSIAENLYTGQRCMRHFGMKDMQRFFFDDEEMTKFGKNMGTKQQAPKNA